MRTLEYVALTIIVGVVVWFLASQLGNELTNSFAESADRIERVN